MSEQSTVGDYGAQSDETVWERFIDGEDEAIEELLRRHGELRHLPRPGARPGAQIPAYAG